MDRNAELDGLITEIWTHRWVAALGELERRGERSLLRFLDVIDGSFRPEIDPTMDVRDTLDMFDLALDKLARPHLDVFFREIERRGLTNDLSVVAVAMLLDDARSAPIVRRALRSESPSLRSDAARAIVRWPDDEVRRDLAHLLTDPDSFVREAATDALASVGDELSIAALEEAASSPVNRATPYLADRARTAIEAIRTRGAT